jgi:hypothetical protein
MPSLAHAIRALSKARGFTLATIAMLALGMRQQPHFQPCIQRFIESLPEAKPWLANS